MSDMSPSEAAQAAKQPDGNPTANNQAGESAPPDPGRGGGGGILGRLLDGSAQGPSVREIQADYELPREVSMIVRGVLRVADSGNGVPPLADMVIGGALLAIGESDIGGNGTDTPADTDMTADGIGPDNRPDMND